MTEVQYYVKPAPRPRNLDADLAIARTAPASNVVSTAVEAAMAVGAKVVTVVADTESALISATAEQRLQIEATAGLTLYPNYEYELAAYLQPYMDSLATASANAALAGPHEYVFVVEGPKSQPISGARVEVWLVGKPEPAVAVTDSTGTAKFELCEKQAHSVDVYPRANYWCGRFEKPNTSATPRKLPLEEISLPFKDSLAHFFPVRDEKHGAGVKVAIIDTGIATHADLPVPVVQRTILDGKILDGADDNGTDHGTHVAGIVAGQGKGIRGVAPGVSLMAYRVFAEGSRTAKSIDITTAIDLAVIDGADIINLSLGFEGSDDSIKTSILNAISSGVLVVAATGNDGKDKLRFPALMPEVCSVGAVGLSEAFAATSTHRAIGVRQMNDDSEFVAAFSNYSSTGVDSAGPGVAVISTTYADGYQALSGTSMAAPVIAGVAAVLLSRDPQVAGLSGDERVKALQKLLYNEGRTLKLDSKYVGSGVPAL
ncbi:S8 family serine peptidase (plasmid) [Ralstonia wenshanensis]|uniref:S8 family serine peptidase n=1 Tax=Ralstonia wenshanensis TaxID=2842456 RepID=UPI001E500FFF|nr:S8 family serine peptidase [Ralstonia wenshanensis]UGS88501.1 S8 family serine peptidase [Ralstonia wenshanensis]